MNVSFGICDRLYIKEGEIERIEEKVEYMTKGSAANE